MWQFGWSVFIGNSEKQHAARIALQPFKLNAWEHPDGKAFYEDHLADVLPAAWKLLVEHYPKMTDAMLRAVPRRYRLEGTGFTKVLSKDLSRDPAVKRRWLAAQDELVDGPTAISHTAAAMRIDISFRPV